MFNIRKVGSGTAAALILTTTATFTAANSADAAPKYSRAQFGTAWTDNNTAPMGRNGCDTRNDILRRDMKIKAIKPNTKGCVVLTGVLYSPYTATNLVFVRAKTNNVDIDHKVPLKLAWDMGASSWTKEKRTRFANDPLNLIAVDAKSNRSKGDKGPGSWMPPNKKYACTYVKNFETVTRTYGLTMKPADAAAVAKYKKGC